MFCSFREVFFSSYLFVFVCCFLMLPLFVVSLLWAAALSLCQGPGRRQNAIFKICGFNAWTFCSTSASSTTDVAAIEAVPLNYQPTITTVIVPVLTPVGTLMLPRTCVRQDVVKRKFQRTPRKMIYYCIAGGWRIQVPHFTSNTPSDSTIIPWKIEERRNELSLPKYTQEREYSHQDHTGKHFTMYLQSILPVIWDWTWGTWTDIIERRKANRSRTRAVGIDYAETTIISARSRRLVATIRRESRDAGVESFRTGTICQNGGK